MAPTPAQVHVTDLDIPFLNLTWFFVKASMALACAVALTSWIWVLILTGMATLSALLVVGLGVPMWFEPATPVAPPTWDLSAPTPSTPAEVIAAPAPAPAPVSAPGEQAIDASQADAPAPSQQDLEARRAATEAAQRAELERARRERSQR